jgi:putative transposase
MWGIRYYLYPDTGRLDLFNPETMDSRMTRKSFVGTLSMAVDKRNPDNGLLLHSDRKNQYAGAGFQWILSHRNISYSKSRKGHCYDNEVVESFFHRLKVECVHNKTYETSKQSKANLFKYIEVFYSRKRLNSYLGYQSPTEFRELQNAV